jgi:hypothetical protein
MKQFAASTSSGYLIMAPASFDQETPLSVSSIESAKPAAIAPRRWWSPFSVIRGKSTPELPQSGSRAPSLVAN